MEKISLTQLRKNARKPITDALLAYAKEHFHEDAARVKDDEFMIPILDEQQNEHYAVIKITIPTGEGHGKIPYDGYAEAENYLIESKAKAERLAEREAKKAEKIKRDKERRELEAKAKAEREAKKASAE